MLLIDVGMLLGKGSVPHAVDHSVVKGQCLIQYHSVQLPSFVKVCLCVIILITIKRAHWVLARIQSLVAATTRG